MTQKLTTYDPMKKEMVLAGVFENGTFYKKVLACHFMKVEQGYGIQEDVILRLIELGCTRIIIDANTNFYEVDFKDWVMQPIKDYGSGLQRFYSVRKANQPLPAGQTTL